MDKIKSAINEKSNLRDKNVLMYLIVCAGVMLQPILEMISSVIINSGAESPISFSGAVRALMMAGILAYTWLAYKGKYKKPFSVYLSAAAGYIALVCLMTVIRGSGTAALYMLGLLADTFFFQFMFVIVCEVFYTVRKRVSPAVMTGTAVIYSIVLVLNFFFKEKIAFKFSAAFSAVLAVLIPFALIFLASKVGSVKEGEKSGAAKALAFILPILGLAAIILGSTYSNSKAVLFVSVFFAVIFFVWAFSAWRNSSTKRRAKPFLKSFIAAAVFCAIIIGLFPISPVKQTFDGTINFKKIFYTYSGVETHQTDSEGKPVVPFFGDEDEANEDSDYVPQLDSGYRPGQDKDDEEEEDKDKDKDKDEDKDESKDEKDESEEESEMASDELTSEPAGDESTSQEETEPESTTEYPYITDKDGNNVTIPGGKPIPKPPKVDQSEMDKWESQFGDQIGGIIDKLPSDLFPTKPGTTKPSSTAPSTKPTPPPPPPTKPKPKPETKPEAQTNAPNEEPAEAKNRSLPAAAIGVGGLRAPVPNISMAINLDRTLFYGDNFSQGNVETVLLGLRFASLFDDDLQPAVKIHSDPIEVLFNYGALGFILYILPLLFIFFKIFKNMFVNFKAVSSSIGYKAYIFASIIMLLMSILDGGIFAVSSVGSIAALVLANCFTLSEQTSERIIKK